MPIPARNWLPPGSLDGAALAMALSPTVDAWAAAWSLRGRVLVDALPSGEPMSVPTEGQWFDAGCGVALAVPYAARDALLGMLIGATPGDRASSKENPVDAAILARLVRECLDDLGRRLAVLGCLPPETRWVLRDGHRLPEFSAPSAVALHCPGAATPLRLIMSSDLAIVLRKAALPAAAVRPPPRPVAEALAGHRIAVAAALGSCRLTLADIASLGVGDVLVLDTPVATPLALVIDDAVVAPASWDVGEGDNNLNLTLLAPVPRMF